MIVKLVYIYIYIYILCIYNGNCGDNKQHLFKQNISATAFF